MKRVLWIVAVVMALGIVANAAERALRAEKAEKGERVEKVQKAEKLETPAKFEKIFLVKVTGFDGQEALQALKSEDFTALQKRIQSESRLFSKALAAAEQDWKAAEETKVKPFPRMAVSQRKLNTVQVFMDQAKADAKLQMMEGQESKSETRRMEREAAREKTLGKAKTIEKTDTKKEERTALESQARDLVEKKLSELIEAEGAKAGGEAAAPQEKPAFGDAPAAEAPKK
jgi:hypothetical protein